MDEGERYTSGNSFRARAEAQQCRYRAHVLELECGQYGHFLTESDAAQGLNFAGRAFEVAQVRAGLGKGVETKRTFGNMLSSQAMCFNIFGQLAGPDGSDADGCEILAAALSPLVHGLKTVDRVTCSPKTDPS